jgi:hypothetical protein
MGLPEAGVDDVPQGIPLRDDIGLAVKGLRSSPRSVRLVERLRCIRRPHFETGVGIAALALGHVLLLVALVLDRDPETSRDVALVAHSAGCPSYAGNSNLSGCSRYAAALGLSVATYDSRPSAPEYARSADEISAVYWRPGNVPRGSSQPQNDGCCSTGTERWATDVEESRHGDFRQQMAFPTEPPVVADAHIHARRGHHRQLVQLQGGSGVEIEAAKDDDAVVGGLVAVVEAELAARRVATGRPRAPAQRRPRAGRCLT